MTSVVTTLVQLLTAASPVGTVSSRSLAGKSGKVGGGGGWGWGLGVSGWVVGGGVTSPQETSLITQSSLYP